ncbi:hypothetical protein C8R47DRAFT_1077159 [Mycena vitilis]|nr:hypothetical protein C8R47DRAFT_1077159 [Mycena vitilis]
MFANCAIQSVRVKPMSASGDCKGRVQVVSSAPAPPSFCPIVSDCAHAHSIVPAPLRVATARPCTRLVQACIPLVYDKVVSKTFPVVSLRCSYPEFAAAVAKGLKKNVKFVSIETAGLAEIDEMFAFQAKGVLIPEGHPVP